MRKLKKYKPTKFMAKTSHYDKDAADYAVMFIESLCHLLHILFFGNITNDIGHIFPNTINGFL